MNGRSTMANSCCSCSRLSSHSRCATRCSSSSSKEEEDEDIVEDKSSSTETTEEGMLWTKRVGMNLKNCRTGHSAIFSPSLIHGWRDLDFWARLPTTRYVRCFAWASEARWPATSVRYLGFCKFRRLFGISIFIATSQWQCFSSCLCLKSSSVMIKGALTAYLNIHCS